MAESMDVSERYGEGYNSPHTSPQRPNQIHNNDEGHEQLPVMMFSYRHRHHSSSGGENSDISTSPRRSSSSTSYYAQTTQSSENTGRSLATPILSTAAAAAPPPSQQMSRRTTISDIEQAHRRASIKHIMADPSLSQLEKRRSIQCLMDGRSARRSTIDSGMTNPYMVAKEAQRVEQMRSSFRRSSSCNSNFDTGVEEDSLPVTSNTRHFNSYTANFSSRTASAASSSTGSSHSHGDDDSAAYPNKNSSIHNYQDYQHQSDEESSSKFISDLLQKKHPYNSTTTKVPALAADAYQTTNNYNRLGSKEYSRRAIEMAPKCTHYSRNCHIVSPCCGATFGCRICHDDCPVLPPLLEQKTMPSPICPPVAAAPARAGVDEDDHKHNNTTTATATTGRKYQRILRTSSMPTSFPQDGPPEHHNVDRFAIREIICRKCYTKQGSKTNNCINCGIKFGEYHCAICNLWMNNEEKPYHCPDCGFCRVGGGENFRHCQDCGMCIDKQLFQDHNCKVGKYMSNCPVCQEDLFSSRDASHELPCGHAIHWHCFRELASHDSRCPMCKKTAETHERMKPTWDAMAMGIALQPVPPELAKVVTIKCNDCEIVAENRSWHFLGVRCKECESFNTVVERITLMGQEAHQFLLTVEQHSSPRSGEVYAAAGGGGQQQSSAVRPARRRRATVDSSVAPTRL